MGRPLVTLRCAREDDTMFLAGLWADVLRRCDQQEQVCDLELLIKATTGSPEQRLLVAEVDAQPAGAVLLRVGTVSPINPEPVVQAWSPHVLPAFRRLGVGRSLMEAAVEYAEELGITHVMSAAAAGSRDGNRFLARLALGPHATARLAATHTVRAKVEAQKPPMERRQPRSRVQLVAARRTMRRNRALQDG